MRASRATCSALAIAARLAAARRGVTSVIIGPRTFAQYEQNMEGFDLTLSEGDVKRLNAVSRVPR